MGNEMGNEISKNKMTLAHFTTFFRLDSLLLLFDIANCKYRHHHGVMKGLKMS